MLPRWLLSYAFCIIGRFQVEKPKEGQQFREIKELQHFRQKQHSKTGRFSKASLITNCGQSFIYKPQCFYWKSEELISCLPILGHQHEQGSTEVGGCQGFFFFFNLIFLLVCNLNQTLWFIHCCFVSLSVSSRVII